MPRYVRDGAVRLRAARRGDLDSVVLLQIRADEGAIRFHLNTPTAAQRHVDAETLTAFNGFRVTKIAIIPQTVWCNKRADALDQRVGRTIPAEAVERMSDDISRAVHKACIGVEVIINAVDRPVESKAAARAIQLDLPKVATCRC